MDHWPSLVADQATLSALSGAVLFHRGWVGESEGGRGVVFFFHFMLWWPRLCWPGSVCMCTLGLTWGQCRISGRISGTELDKRTWRFPLEKVRQKKTLSLWGKHFILCLFDPLLLLVLSRLSPDASLQMASQKSVRYGGVLMYPPSFFTLLG